MKDLNIIESVYSADKNIESFISDYYNSILLNTNFSVNDLYDIQQLSKEIQEKICKKLEDLLRFCFNQLKEGGLLFVYGLPKYLILYSSVLSKIKNDKYKFLFKYWISLEINDMPRKETLKPSHVGLLTFLKTRNRKKPIPFHLNTKDVRVPHKECRSCNHFIKDYGGYKDRRNPKGACLSDVWRDLEKRALKDHIIPEDLKKRIINLVKNKEKDFRFLYLVESNNIVKRIINGNKQANRKYEKSRGSQIHIENFNVSSETEKNSVIEADCLEYMKKISKKYPNGVFDLIFADPPYNLEKEYFSYDDDLLESEYLNWCQKWIKSGIKLLKPGGSFLILNIPKWSLFFAKFLLNKLDFRHWIVWDAMSRPNGKIMPAHYSLLYFTKTSASHKFNYDNKNYNDQMNPIDSDIYCLREKCINKRKEEGEDLKLELSDIWWDIHRIKHKKDRNYHPCQLPLKLMIRIINMTTNPGDIIFDPFSGTGTTSLAASILKRNYISTEIDKNYISISRNNLKDFKKFEDKLRR